MIKKIVFVNKHTFINYIVENSSSEELNIPFVPNNEKDYDSFLILDNDQKIQVPIDILLGKSDIPSEDRDKYKDLCKEIDPYYDEDGNELNIKEVDNYKSFQEINSRLKIFDLTDKEINGYEVLDITTKPIWLFNGKRKFQYELKGLNNNYISATFRMESIKSEKKENIGYTTELKDSDTFFIDTDEIGKSISVSDSDGVSTNSYIDFKLKNLIISCPIDIKVIDLSLDNGIHDKEEISIDFGTSSTCIAYSVNKMLHFSDRVEKGSEEEYENITSFFIYNWENMKTLWNSYENNLPHLLKLDNNLSEELEPNSNKHFGDGRNVQNLMQDLKKEKLDATVFEIKHFATLNKNIKFRQYYNNMISPDLELGFGDKAVLNPLEFYAYLIGRKLNSPIKGNVYSKYHLTIPVKYSLDAVNKIKESFKIGLARSLPNNINSNIDVITRYDEPTALLGSILNNQITDITEPKFFSIFDFGGGTLDYIFGVVRPPVDSGRIYLEDKEEEEYSYVIELFNSGGSNECGGEKILKRMAYKIYLQNAALLGETVPILVPDGEEQSDQVNSSLYGNGVINRVNLEIIVEKFARKILYGIELDQKKKKWTSSFLVESKNFAQSILSDDVSCFDEEEIENGVIKEEVSLRKKDSNEEPFLLEINVDEIIDLYVNIIKDNIEGFKKDLEEVVKLDRVKDIVDEYNIQDLDYGLFKIYLAGNSCKSPVVKNAFKMILEYSDIFDIISDKYNLKTAVAKGYKRLNGDILIYNWKKEVTDDSNYNSEPLKYKIIHFNLGETMEILPKNSQFNEEFKKLSGLELGQNSFTIYYTENSKLMNENDIGKEVMSKTVEIPKDIVEKYIQNKGKIHVYIQAYGYDKIIYGFGKKKEISKEVLTNLDEFKNKCVITL